jgi:hypothetical protein
MAPASRPTRSPGPTRSQIRWYYLRRTATVLVCLPFWIVMGVVAVCCLPFGRRR